MAETSDEVVRRYLEDAIAAESNLIEQLKDFAGESPEQAVKSLFEQHRMQAEDQHRRLVGRLEALGGKAPGTKGLLSYLFGSNQKAGTQADTTQNLIASYAATSSHIAMYEALATIAEAAGDPDTVQLARSIQQEERAAAEKTWSLFRPVATEAIRRAAATAGS